MKGQINNQPILSVHPRSNQCTTG